MKWDAAGEPIAHFHHETTWSLDEEYVLMGELAIIHHFAGNFKSAIGGKIQHQQWSEHLVIADHWFRRFQRYDREPIKLIKQAAMIPNKKMQLTCGNLTCSNNCHQRGHCQP
jgi:hypothetical protein